MKISGLSVCVNNPDAAGVGYCDLFARSIDRWRAGLDRLVVVTTPEDAATQALATAAGAELHVTDAFTRDLPTGGGAAFNKGRAMAEACEACGLRAADPAEADGGWLLTFDSDVIPPVDWRRALEMSRPSLASGKLYGCRRWQLDELAPIPGGPAGEPTGTPMPQGWVIGFFCLFALSDPHLPGAPEPLFQIHWGHCGNYDTEFTNRWARSDQIILNHLRCWHLGPERQNWVGRSPQARAQLQRILSDRRRRGGTWQHERIAGL